MESAILLVENNSTTRALVEHVLHQAGHQVVGVASGAAAAALLGERCWDVVLAEVDLPDYHMLLNALRETKDAPALIVQSGSCFEHALIALRARAVDYLCKPYARDELLASVALALDEHRTAQRQRKAISVIAEALEQLRGTDEAGAPPLDMAMRPDVASQLRVGQLLIDRLRHEVLFAGQRVSVTPTQFKLLCCLAERAGDTLSGMEIVAYTHGVSVGNDEALLLLKSHMRNLRRLIAPAYFGNVRGYGYRLAPPDDELPQYIPMPQHQPLRELVVGG